MDRKVFSKRGWKVVVCFDWACFLGALGLLAFGNMQNEVVMGVLALALGCYCLWVTFFVLGLVGVKHVV